ncbi:MAG: bifunctional phosphoglucose/phosphomannose isomerase [Dehalococcoidia bacterium]
MESLDDPSLYTRLDPTGMRHRLRGLPQQCREAWDQAQKVSLLPQYAAVEAVVVAGMGGSAIGGDLLADLAALEEAPPVTVVRGYQLPAFVGENTLVIASSYSGSTEETLAVFQQALERSCQVVAVTGGGALEQRARDAHIPLVPVQYQGEPRCALGYSFVVPLALLQRLGLLADKLAELSQALETLEALAERLGEEAPRERNPAKRLAEGLLGRLPVVYGAGIFTGVARRWKTQFNENAKVWAFFDTLPELHHNSVVGYGLPAEVERRLLVLLLQPQGLLPRLDLRYRITGELLEQKGIAYQLIRGEGRSPLAQMLSAVLLGDFVSYYLALLQGIDPSPVPVIDFIKGRLAAG